MTDKKQILKTLKWLLPTWYEIIIYGMIIIGTIIASNFHVVEQFFELTDDFDIRRIILNLISSGLESLIGTKVSATLVTAVFWLIFGIIIYTIFWFVGSFSSELTGDIASRKYIHPRGTNPDDALKSFARRSVFRLISAVALTFYLNFLIHILFPFIASNYQDLLQRWTELAFIRNGLLLLVLEIAALHIIAILSRLVLLRRRVFSS